MDQPGIHISLAEPTDCSLKSKHSIERKSSIIVVTNSEPEDSSSNSRFPQASLPLRYAQRVAELLWKFAKFIGPGAIISVAYIDPDNYQSDLTAGAKFKYKLLSAALSTKLGCVTGMDLAQMNRAHLHPWLNIALYILAEAAIICTDIGQVIGTAIALNLLNPKITLTAGCVISVSDTLFILLFYKPDGSIRRLRVFEILFQSCAILGGNLMPHTIYLGSGLVQARMREFDHQNEKYHEARISDSQFAIMLYRPTLSAIKSCMSYTITELCITLLVVASFVNSAILIVAAASLSEADQDADLQGMYHLFVNTMGHAAGTIFAVGLLFSGVSAGIVATMAGQLICEGAMDWHLSPFWRRLVTRFISIVPAVSVAAATGRRGLADALNACNVVLSVSLIFITFPLVWYTSFDRGGVAALFKMANPSAYQRAFNRCSEALEEIEYNSTDCAALGPIRKAYDETKAQFPGSSTTNKFLQEIGDTFAKWEREESTERDLEAIRAEILLLIQKGRKIIDLAATENDHNTEEKLYDASLQMTPQAKSSKPFQKAPQNKTENPKGYQWGHGKRRNNAIQLKQPTFGDFEIPKPLDVDKDPLTRSQNQKPTAVASVNTDAVPNFITTQPHQNEHHKEDYLFNASPSKTPRAESSETSVSRNNAENPDGYLAKQMHTCSQLPDASEHCLLSKYAKILRESKLMQEIIAPGNSPPPPKPQPVPMSAMARFMHIDPVSKKLVPNPLLKHYTTICVAPGDLERVLKLVEDEGLFAISEKQGAVDSVSVSEYRQDPQRFSHFHDKLVWLRQL
ncbi:hypothetical protein NHQ30_002727 [Ciborinia camelliae]|nr:hypothetical protein NHQ30_002727 [Ciborinia camelliae]